MQFRRDIMENKGNKNFIKLKDKESIVGVFRGDLNEFFVVWEGNKTKVVQEGTPGGKLRFRVNFLIKEGTSYTPKIFEGGVNVYNQLAELHEEYDLEKTVVKITRNGSGTDTTYSLLPLLKQALSKEALKFLSTTELLPLDSSKENSAGGANVPHVYDSEEIPF